VEALAAAFATAHMATLAFNWSGVGASGGEISGDLDRADGDYAAALAELARRGGTHPIVAAGYSFGAATALRLAAQVDRLVLVAPPVAMLGAEALRGCPRPTAVLVGDADDYAPGDMVAALMPKRPDAHLEILPGVDHFFTAEDALVRLRYGIGAALA
jgi:alpha/beta superfamily hydrolase